jgi:hypothetical protein
MAIELHYILHGCVVGKWYVTVGPTITILGRAPKESSEPNGLLKMLVPISANNISSN